MKSAALSSPLKTFAVVSIERMHVQHFGEHRLLHMSWGMAEQAELLTSMAFEC